MLLRRDEKRCDHPHRDPIQAGDQNSIQREAKPGPKHEAECGDHENQRNCSNAGQIQRAVFFSRRARNEPKKVAVPNRPNPDATSALIPTEKDDPNIACPAVKIEIRQYTNVNSPRIVGSPNRRWLEDGRRSCRAQPKIYFASPQKSGRGRAPDGPAPTSGAICRRSLQAQSYGCASVR